MAHMRLIEEQNLELKSNLEQLRTEYVNQKNELEKALAKLHNDGEYIKALEFDLEKARNLLRDKVLMND